MRNRIHKGGLVAALFLLCSPALRAEPTARGAGPNPTDTARPRDELKVLAEEQRSLWEEIASRITVGGYGVLEYEKFEGTANSFDGLKVELLVAGRIHDRIRLYNELEFEGVADVTNQGTTTALCAGDGNGDGVVAAGETVTCVTGLTGGRGGNIELEQSYFDFLIARWINVRGGILAVPFGKFNLDHFDPRIDLTDDPIVARRIVPTTWSDVGFGLFGTVPLGEAVRWSYEIYAMNGLTNGFSATGGGLRGARGGFRSDNNADKAVAGRMAFKVLDQYEVGFSGYRGDYDPASSAAITGLDADFTLTPKGTKVLEDFEWKGEVAYFKVGGSTAPSSLWGFYTQLNYHFWPHFLDKTFLGKNFTRPTFTLVGRYGMGRINTTAGTGNLQEQRLTVGLNYRPVEEFVVKTEYQINRSGATGGLERAGSNGFIASVSWLF